MQSSLIGKIQKAQLYAREPERLQFGPFTATFRGDNGDHTVSYQGPSWTCSCGYFQGNAICSHVMAAQKMLSTMLSSDARYWSGAEREVAAVS